MISISGIKYQEELERLPYFNKKAAKILIGKDGKNLDKKIGQLIKKRYLLPLKKGFYVSSVFAEKTDQKLYREYLANVLRFPSYLSLEYVLSEFGLIPEGTVNLTSVTLKSSRIYSTPLGTFVYQSIQSGLFTGFAQKDFGEQKIKIATPAKALFDFFYLRKMINPKKDITEDLRINWDNFSRADLTEFIDFVKLIPSPKMTKILKIMRKFL